jgi:allantoate deiminase
MEGRSDALVAAADFISEVHDAAQQVDDLRATVGTCRVGPGVANGIPDLAELTLEIRAPDDTVREDFAAKTRVITKACAHRRGARHAMERTYVQPAVPCAPELRGVLSEVINATSHDETMTLPSGATHDASAMADLCDIAMLFVRCRDGVSHRPEEYASAADMGVAIEVLSSALMALTEKP